LEQKHLEVDASIGTCRVQLFELWPAIA